MAEATSKYTSNLLKQAVEAGRTAEKAVARFRGLARQSISAFDSDVDPLGLPDDEYRAIGEKAGVQTVFDLAQRIEDHMQSLTGRAA